MHHHQYYVRIHSRNLVFLNYALEQIEHVTHVPSLLLSNVSGNSNKTNAHKHRVLVGHIFVIKELTKE